MGAGNTYIVTALMAAVCRLGIQARFLTASPWVMMLRRAKEKDRLNKELETLA